MEKIINYIKKNKFYLIGAVIGGIGGFFYWQYVGCTSGSCPITSSPVMSILWGALMGALIVSIIFPKKHA